MDRQAQPLLVCRLSQDGQFGLAVLDLGVELDQLRVGDIGRKTGRQSVHAHIDLL
jgi:hypothetical protein